ncbi:nucleoside phosphorylase domain-containing protein [Chaetomium sp. MPI-CAGE-AT-0009]|nr:nucleoside phosphorylase domain-containing protein [Chaetomium sp. MPI-CAGE-AT-0009]
MAAAGPTKPRSHDAYIVGWVCTLPKEQTAATAMLDEMHLDLPKPPKDTNTYTLGSIGRHNIVIACLPKGRMGANMAAATATQMQQTFPSIQVGLMVGISGGVPSKVRLGDVVVSVPVDEYPGVVQWDFGKLEKNGPRRTGSLNSPPGVLLTAVGKMETTTLMKGSEIPRYLSAVEQNWPDLVPAFTRPPPLRPPTTTAMLAPRVWWQAVASAAWAAILLMLRFLLGRGVHAGQVPAVDAPRKPGDVRVHYGLIASGNRVVKNAAARDKLDRDLGGHVLCIDMEAAGLMNVFPCIAIRGICNYADEGKNKEWQEYAATVAAACAKELLRFVQPGDVDKERPTKDLFGKVLDEVSSTGANVAQVKTKPEREEDLQVLQWLTPVNHGLQHSDYSKRRQRGTGQWLLDSTECRADLVLPRHSGCGQDDADGNCG